MEIAQEQLNNLIAIELEQSCWARKFHFLWLVFEDPNSNILGLLWATSIMTLIIISSVCFVIETLPDLCCGKKPILINNVGVDGLVCCAHCGDLQRISRNEGRGTSLQ